MSKTSNIKETILGISIALILALFVGYGIQTFYDSPKYEDFCNLTTRDITTENDCLIQGGQWVATPIKEGAELKKEGFCDVQYSCRNDFDEASQKYNKVVFIIAIILGLSAVILGGVILKLPSVSAGIMGGGALTIIYGTLRYWGNLADVGRFFVLGIVLAVLIWIGYKKIKK